jgi:hypothetical protein
MTQLEKIKSHILLLTNRWVVPKNNGKNAYVVYEIQQ